MNALTKSEPTGEVAEFGGSILAVIERAARDPNVDIDKMERLLAMQERVQARQAQAAFTEAKIAMRPELPEITMKGRIIVREKLANGQRDGKITQDTPFARFEDIHEAITPVLSRYGFDLSYRNETAPDGKVRVITILSHIAGHSEQTHFDLPHDSSGSKNPVQAVGSSTSYGKRYGTLSILNIKVAGEDDDGKAAGEREPVEPEINDDQRNILLTMLEQSGADVKGFCTYYKIPSVKELPAKQYDSAHAMLAKKLAAKGAQRGGR